MNSTIALRPAGLDDAELLLSYARAFHMEDGHPLSPLAEEALKSLLGMPEAGRIFIIEDAGQPAGYGVLCFGFSIEFGGRDCFIDDLYIVPQARGRGVGAASIALLSEISRTFGCKALHLEVMAENERAARLYTRHGFKDRGSMLMSQRLTDGQA